MIQKAFSFFCLLLLAAFQLSMGQSMAEAEKSLANGDHKHAVKELDGLLENAATLKDKDASEAFILRAKAKMGYINRVLNNEGLNKDNSERMAEYGASLYDDLKASRDRDKKEKMKVELDELVKKASESLDRLTNATLHEARKNDTPDELKKAYYQHGIGYCNASIAINERNYLPHAQKGDCLLALGQKSDALKSYHLSDEHFFRSAPKRGDLNIALVYSQIANLEIELNKNNKGALEALDEGISRLKGEMNKISRLADLRPADLASYQIKYEELLQGLENQKKDLGGN